ncbi:four helix bundle protein [Ekhidna sp.]|uniref:four helix bundle protein n=1 Tax=Ekhidna sp. TaxID=2608089 RepID=UPI003C7985C0
MEQKKENVILDKSYSFAIEIIECYKTLTSEAKEFVLSKQLLRSGTSIGANVEEANGGYTKKDFKYKMSIAYKEARETKYWLRLLMDTNYIEVGKAELLLEDCEQILKILWKIMESSG